jgi:hypothetical protein
MITTCDAFYYVESDEIACAEIAAENGISLAQFYAWNPTVGTGCSSLWTDYYVCVSIIGVSPLPLQSPLQQQRQETAWRLLHPLSRV